MFIIVLSRQSLYEDRSENVEFELLDFQPVLSVERNRIGRKQGENEMLGRRRIYRLEGNFHVGPEKGDID